MRAWVCLLAAVLAFSVTAAAGAAPKAPTRAEVQRLENRVNRLEQSLRQTNATLIRTQTELRDLQRRVAFNADKSDCMIAISFDWLRWVANVVGVTDINPLDDAGACARIGLTRMPVLPR